MPNCENGPAHGSDALQLASGHSSALEKGLTTNDHPESPAAAIPRRRWGIALLLGLGVLVNYVDRVNLSVSQSALHETFAITTVTFGWLLGAYSWTYALLQLPTGVLLDRFGVRVVGRISIFIWSLASFGAAVSPGVTAFFAARLLLGVGEAPTFPANAKATGYWFPVKERSLATAIFDAAAKFAPAVGVPLVGIMMVHFGWRISFAATGLLSLCYFGLFYRFYRNPSEDKHLSEQERAFITEGGAQPEGPGRAGKGASLAYLARQPKVIGVSIGFASYNYTFYLLLTWMPSYLSTTMHIDLVHSAFYTAIPWLVATFTDLLVGGWLVDALVQRGWNAVRVRQVVLIGGTALGMGILGAAYATTAAAALFWISLSIGGLSAAAPVGWSIPSLIAPRESVGSVGGMMNFASQLSAISAPVVTGYVFGLMRSFAWAFGVAAIFLAVGVASYILLLGNMEPVPEPA
jgi:MFS family permease